MIEEKIQDLEIPHNEHPDYTTNGDIPHGKIMQNQRFLSNLLKQFFNDTQSLIINKFNTLEQRLNNTNAMIASNKISFDDIKKSLNDIRLRMNSDHNFFYSLVLDVQLRIESLEMRISSLSHSLKKKSQNSESPLEEKSQNSEDAVVVKLKRITTGLNDNLVFQPSHYDDYDDDDVIPKRNASCNCFWRENHESKNNILLYVGIGILIFTILNFALNIYNTCTQNRKHNAKNFQHENHENKEAKRLMQENDA